MISPAAIAEQHYLNPEMCEAVAQISDYIVDDMVPPDCVQRFIEDVRAAQGLIHTTEYKTQALSHATLAELITHYNDEVVAFISGGDMAYETYIIFYDYFTANGLMPYDVAKARSGDPYEWIHDRLTKTKNESKI